MSNRNDTPSTTGWSQKQGGSPSERNAQRLAEIRRRLHILWRSDDSTWNVYAADIAFLLARVDCLEKRYRESLFARPGFHEEEEARFRARRARAKARSDKAESE